jgi:hypothetical protein
MRQHFVSIRRLHVIYWTAVIDMVTKLRFAGFLDWLLVNDFYPLTALLQSAAEPLRHVIAATPRYVTFTTDHRSTLPNRFQHGSEPSPPLSLKYNA